jgi:hypothetical protein
LDDHIPQPMSGDAAPAIEYRGRPIDQFGPVEMLILACVGTAAAGGLFPVVLLLVDAVQGTLQFQDDIFFALPGFVLGFLYAGVVSIFTALAMGLFMWLTQIRRAPLWLASTIGGWTGFACTVPLAANLSLTPVFSLVVATFMGQAGVTLFVAWVASLNYPSARRADPPARMQIGLRQLFGATTFACLCAALMGAAHFSRELLVLIAVAAAQQAITIGAAMSAWRGWTRWKRTRSTPAA